MQKKETYLSFPRKRGIHLPYVWRVPCKLNKIKYQFFFSPLFPISQLTTLSTYHLITPITYFSTWNLEPLNF